MIDFDIDLVIPYVDNKEPVWIETYNNYCKNNHLVGLQRNINSVRFDDLGFFESMLKNVDKFMPWVRKIFLIVSNIEQVPEYINKEKTCVVLHKDIIPAKFLPTFNSTTIEMFIQNIPDLSEHFIYSNDDMYPVGKLSKEDFFTESGKIRMNFKEKNLLMQDNMFRRVCLNCQHKIDMILKTTRGRNIFMKPNHTMTPMIKSHIKYIHEKLDRIILPKCGVFRTDEQHNQYLYPLYELGTNNCEQSFIDFKYISFKHNPTKIINEIKNGGHQIICINDVETPNRDLINHNKKLIINALNECK